MNDPETNRTEDGLIAKRALAAAGFALAGIALALSALVIGCDSRELYAGHPPHVEKRHLKLEGAPNFRDLGGYATDDGRTVRWGRFYRSDNLASLTDADLARVGELGLKLVCDFRGPDEKAEEPDRLPEQNPPAVAELEIFDESFSSAGLREKLMSGELEDFDGRQLLIDANRLFVTRFVDRYASMFDRLMDERNLPAVVHCTAGKDRAGLASALLLRTLGVPMETVFDDFLLTNHYTAEKIDRTMWFVRLMSIVGPDPDRVRPLLGVEPAFLEAAFETIDANHGSFDAFRREALGIDDTELAAFRELALEPVANGGRATAR